MPTSGTMGLLKPALAFAAGAGLLYTLPTIPSPWLLGAGILVLGSLGFKRPGARLLFWGILGMGWAGFRAALLLGDALPEALIRQDLQVEGRIASLPERRDRGVRFLFHIDRATHGDRAVPVRGRVRLRWYPPVPPIRAGERYALTVRLKPPHGFANPGGFDYERWLFQRGIRGTGYVRQKPGFRRLDSGAGPYLLHRWRQHLRERLLSLLGDTPGTGLVLALVLGDRSHIGTQERTVFQRTGTSHLLAISGLHVGLVAGGFFFLIRWGWSRSAVLVQHLAAPRAAALGALFAALFYSALAGFAIPTQRASLMVAVVLAALFWGRTLRPSSGLALALVGVLVWDPTALLSAGFWLSFTAVAGLLYGLGNRLPGKRAWGHWIQAQWVVTLSLFPLLLLSIGQVSWIALGVNLLVIPLFSFLLLPLVLFAALVALLFGLGEPLRFSAELLDWGQSLLAQAAAWDWAAGGLPARPLWVWGLACIGVLWLLAPAGFPGRGFGSTLLLPLVLLPPPRPPEGVAWFRLLDVGQGLAAVIRTRHHCLLYDTGPGYPGGFNTGTAVVAPFLRWAGIREIDLLILSHGDRDHMGGFPGLAAALPIQRILTGEPRRVEDPRAVACRAGQAWSWDGVRFRILHPPSGRWSGNDASCVLEVATSGARVLLPGDLERRGERAVLETGAVRPAAILVAGHHGSKTSSSPAFLRAVAPRWVLYSAGYRNRFGFPAAPVQTRVARLGARPLNTARTGSIRFRLTPTGLEGPRLFRQAHPRLWHRDRF